MVKSILRLFGIMRFRDYTLIGQKYKPMLRLLEELRARGLRIEDLDALEIFGRDGLDHTTTYADGVKSLEVWEIDKRHRSVLEKNFPNALIRIVDSYRHIESANRRFDLIVIDNAIGIYGSHCDHFDFFPDSIFRIARDTCTLVLIVIPRIEPSTIRHFPDLSSPAYLDRRAAFYGVSDAVNIPMDRIVDTYRGFAELSGYRLVWSFSMKRSGAGVDYLAMHIVRQAARATAGTGTAVS